MSIYVEVNDVKYLATITGRLEDRDWDNRASKAIKVRLPYSDAAATFVDNIKWNIIQDVDETVEHINEETGDVTYEIVTKQEVYDNSEYSIAGDIIDHRNGFVTVKMGKPTAEEILAMFEEVM